MTQTPHVPTTPEYIEPTPPALKFAFRVRLFFKERIRFQPTTPNGGRVYVPPAGGDITGPMLQGKVVPYSGADWARRHLDGAAELNAHYMLEASDGAPIYVHNRGFLYGRDADGRPTLGDAAQENQKEANPDGTTRWRIADDTYFICIPAFDAPVGPHDWLTRNVIIGRGRRIPAPDHTVFDYYIADPWRNI
jgi:uncharacterized protein DUF3237